MMELSGYVLEMLRENQEFALYRGRRHGNPLPVLLLTPTAEQPTPASLKRLEHEYSLAAELDAAWMVRPLALTRHDGRPLLVLEDFGGEPLDRTLGRPLALTHFLRIAIGLAAALGQVHRHGLIHKDIKPANVLVDAAGNVRLTGFGIASRLLRERQEPAPPEVIAGTLAYMAPEQTGRMNRSIDSRSDLYSLGVTLYEMLTGTLPFTATEPMEWIHCHIARQPMPPGERVNGIPAALSAIISKLLSKNAEDRYQTTAGVEADLRKCLMDLETHDHIDAFLLGTQDVPDRLLIPEKLYGRERETDALLAAFDRVVTQGAAELVLVSGYAGIGKSSVVNELHKVLVPPRGLFAAGKFDQYKRDIPYATLAQAFQSLVRQLLSADDAELNRWRQALLEALGPNGQLMVNLIPELAFIIGEQPPVADLPPQDRQTRFQLVFRRFLAVFAQAEHPLALFLDDLQWLDTATLDLIEHLITHPEVRHLLLVGAYRDNEVGPSHPLMRTLRVIRGAGLRAQEIVLGPLKIDDLGWFLVEGLHTDRERVRPLAELVFEKTSGNPFFAIQFVTALEEQGLLAFNPDASAWQWDLNRIHAKGYTDNVVDLMATKLSRLPDMTRDALGQLACLGNVVDIATLTLVHGGSDGKVHADLREAVEVGLVLRTNISYAFLHDRVQEAAYALIPAADRAAAHLRIGRALTTRTAPEEIEESIFAIVNHLNRGAALITTQQEREQVAELDLIAGKRAKTSTAYASAQAYFAAGRALLGEDSWERHYRLTFDLELHRAECEFASGGLAAAEARLAVLAAHAATLSDQADVVCLAVLLFFTTDRGERAVETGLEFLQRVGIAWSSHPTDEEIQEEYERMRSKLASRPIDKLIDLPAMVDPACVASMNVLSGIFPAAHYVDKNLLELILLRMANLSLEYGNGDGSSVAYAALNMVLGPRFGDYQTAYRLGQLACQLVDRRGLDLFKARVYSCFGSFAMSWMKHLPASQPLLRLAFDVGSAIGDLSFAAYTFRNLITNLFVSGLPLGDVQREAEQALAFAKKTQLGLPAERFIGQLALIRALRGVTPDPSPANNGSRERWPPQQMPEQPYLVTAVCFHWIFSLVERFFAHDYAAGIEAAAHVEGILWSTRSCFEEADYHFYAALTRAAACDRDSSEQRERHLRALTNHHRQIALWAENCPENFANRAALVGAEIARLNNRDLDAMRLYEKAIGSAREHGFVQNEGIANELAARFYAARGFEKIAQAYLRDTRSCYLRWGADGKVRQLDQLHPQLREEPSPPRAATTIGTSIEHLDLSTVVKVSQAVSGEIVLEKLIEKLMAVALEHAGAERGLLILPRDEEMHIEAEATTGRDTVEVLLRQAVVTPSEIPESILRYVIRTKDSLLLDDASAPNQFSADEYIRQRHCRSVLCLPLVKQSKLIGVLYLENSLTPHAFTPARIAVLKLLASQAAISLENARLYDEFTEREARIRRLVEANIIGIVIWDIEGRIIEANEAFLRMVGYSREDLLSGVVSWREVTPDKWRAADEQALAELAAIGTCEPFEKEYFRKDGSRVPVLVGPALLEGSQEKGVAFVLDLTERKRTEDRLRRSEAYLAEAQRLSLTGSFGWNVSTGEIFWSDETYRIVGLDRGSKPTLHEVFQRVHPEDIARVRETLDRGIQSGTDLDFEHRLVMPDGSVKHVRVVGRPSTQDASGDLEFVGAVTDITERRQLEGQLLEGQQRFRLLSESSLTGIYLIQGGRFRYVNPIMARMFGYEIEEVVDQLGPLDLTYPDDRHIVGENVRRRIEGEAEEMHYDFRGLRKDGSVFYVEVHGRRIEHGGKIGVIGTLLDITERKRAEQRFVLQHTVTRRLAVAATLEEVTPRILQTVCEFLQWELGALWSLDREAGVLRCVEVWHKESVKVQQFEVACRQSNFMPGIGLPGRVWSSREPAYISDVTDDANFPRASIAAREGLHAAFGFPILLGGDVLGVMEFFAHEIRQPEPELLSMMAALGSQIGQFIEAKRAEEALRKTQGELAHVARVMTMGELTASIAHEVNQPLAAVVANANAGLRWLANSTPNLEEVRDAMSRIARDGKRASGVIGRIRALVKKDDPEKAPLDINEVIQEVLSLMHSEIQKSGIVLKLNLANGLPRLLGDRIQLQQVILNLVMNGIEAMNTVTDRSREMVIRSSHHESDKVLVAAQDSGVGVDSQDLEKIFNTFYTTKSQGMGMGLAICRSIIENHGGRLWVMPNDGPGATFQFTLSKANEES